MTAATGESTPVFMDVLVVTNLYPPLVLGGYEILCAEVADRLAARGHRVRVLTSAWEAGRARPADNVWRTLAMTTPFPRPGEDVGTVDWRLSSQHAVAVRNRSETRRALEAGRTDVVFCWSLNRISLGPVFAAVEAGVPVVWTMNDEHPKQFRFVRSVDGLRAAGRRAAEALWPMATMRPLPAFPVAVISTALKRKLQALGLPIEHATLVRQGVPLDELRYRPKPRGPREPLRVVYLGQLSRVKGVHTVLWAVAELVGRGVRVHLTVAGSGVPAYVRELESEVARAGIEEAVEFAGWVPHREVASTLHRHHVLVFPSEWDEPFGLSHLEAMACGCAVVSTTTGGSAELIRDGENALSFPAGDAHALAQRLATLAADDAMRLSLADRARACVEAHHSIEAYTDRLEEMLCKAVDSALGAAAEGSPARPEAPAVGDLGSHADPVRR